MKKHFYILLLLIVSTTAKAQTWLGVTAGPEFSIPNYYVGNTTGYGVFINPQWTLIDDVITGGLVSGVIHYAPHNGSKSLSFIPLLMSGRFNITNNALNPIVGVDIGISYMLFNGDKYPSGAPVEVIFRNQHVKLTSRFFCGAEYWLSDSFGIYTNVKYTYMIGPGSANSMGVDAGLFYKFW